MLGDESYELYPDRGIAINTQFMHQAAKQQAATISSTLRNGASKSATIKGTIVRDGKECFEIETTMSEDTLAAFNKSVSADLQKMIPKGERVLIEKHTYLLVEMESVSQSGTILTKSEFKEVSPQAELADDLFLLPDGIEFQKPTTIEEYMKLLVAMLKPPSANLAPRAKPRVPPVTAMLIPPVMGPVKIDPKSGRAIAAVPPGMTRAEFDRVIAEKVVGIRATTKAEPESLGMSTVRIAGIAASLLTGLVFLAAIVQRRFSRARASSLRS